ncbi:creatininase family protein [Rariglobus hedericola]|uniref:Creatininase family protein n=2 Tax=Rariglobus hedericola TaxID=2597822 RepID=A0A556QMQ1_9BACT|nr:creatininase family protein [Rariglobus hedericola]
MEISEIAERERVVLVVPVAGFADHGPDLPLDAEEQILMRVVKEASLQRGETRLLVVPPLRFVTGPADGAAFTVEVPVAHAFIDEVCASLAAVGFRRVVLCNASPWNEELCDAAARDIRIARGLQMFCVNLSALEIGFAATEDAEFAKAGGRLAALFAEIAGRPALANDGKLLTMEAPAK